MRLGPRPTHPTQPWVVWVGLGPSYKVLTLYDDRSRFNLDRSSFKAPGLGPTQLHNTPGAGSGPAPRPGLYLSSDSRARSHPLLSYPQPPSHRGDPKTDNRPATEPEEHPDSRHRHPRNPFEAGDPTHARFTTNPVRSDPTRSDPIRSGTQKLVPGIHQDMSDKASNALGGGYNHHRPNSAATNNRQSQHNSGPPTHIPSLPHAVGGTPGHHISRQRDPSGAQAHDGHADTPVF
ncbi:hypothetical protein PGT21_028916 [Puccinia graminis f. sp. tritici]|uniref:Uncharacterized protein n=1 Tax=Puccinia graminis f. sp. tritici TaxID=56615 RepID=A0A5B0PP54_PUCGR|nr:hypothetical protein PGT21_028916 [Puccinia graminis f. sp. tritici]